MLPPCVLDKAQRDALLGQSLPYRDLFCPRKPLSLNTGSGQFPHGWVPTGMPSIRPGKGSQCPGSELKWEKGSAEGTVSNSLLTHLFICVTALHTASTAGSRVNKTPSPAEGKFASHRFGCFQKTPQVQPSEGCVGVFIILYMPRPLSTGTWVIVCPIAHLPPGLVDLCG